jgi:hypothetical protein
LWLGARRHIPDARDALGGAVAARAGGAVLRRCGGARGAARGRAAWGRRRDAGAASCERVAAVPQPLPLQRGRCAAAAAAVTACK